MDMEGNVNVTKEMTWAAYQHAQKMGWTWLNESSVRDIVEAALSASPAGVVKPLEFRPAIYDDVFHADEGVYVVAKEKASALCPGWTCWRGKRRIGWIFTTDAEAKSAAFADYSARIMSAIEPAGVGVETEWKSAWIARGTVVAFPGGGFDVGDCPDPEQLAIFIAEAVNAYRPTASLKGDEQ